MSFLSNHFRIFLNTFINLAKNQKQTKFSVLSAKYRCLKEICIFN